MTAPTPAPMQGLADWLRKAYQQELLSGRLHPDARLERWASEVEACVAAQPAEVQGLEKLYALPPPPAESNAVLPMENSDEPR